MGDTSDNHRVRTFVPPGILAGKRCRSRVKDGESGGTRALALSQKWTRWPVDLSCESPQENGVPMRVQRRSSLLPQVILRLLACAADSSLPSELMALD
jgi:hypothetical protein